MDNHVYSILQVLSETNRIYTKYQYFAGVLNISLRTVNRKISEVESFLNTHDYKYYITRGKGIKLDLTKTKNRELKNELMLIAPNYFSLHDRLTFITLELLQSSDYLQIDYLAAKLKVSINTIQSDLDQVNDKLIFHNIKLIKERGKGIITSGELADFSNIYTLLVFENIDIRKIDYFSNNLIHLDVFKRTLSPLVKKNLLNITPLDFINGFHNKLEENNSELRFYLADGTYLMLLINISNIYYLIPNDIRINSIEDKKIKSFLKILFSEKKLISKQLINYLITFFSSARITNTIDGAYTIDEDKLSIEKEQHLILEELLNEFYEEIELSSKFVHSLEQHLILFIKRYNKKHQMPIQYTNHFLKEYQDIALRVKTILIHLGYKEILDDEVVYISIHLLGAILEKKNQHNHVKVALICFSGFGTSHVLKETLIKKFHNLEIYSIYTTNNIDELELIKNGVGMIISTVPVDITFIPTVLVNPFLTEIDLEKINNMLRMKKDKKNMRNYSNKISKLNDLQQELINNIVEEIYFKEIDYVSSLEELVKIIVRDNFITEERNELEDKILAREKLGSSILSEDKLLLLHTRYKSYTRLGVIRLKYALEHPENNVPINIILFMIVPEQNNTDIISLVSKISESLITKDKFIDDLKNIDERYLSNLFMETIKNN